MSFRVDAPWIADSFIVGNQGGGVLAEDLATTGDSGDGFLSACVTLPADNGKEIRALITYVPPGLTMYAYEDGSVIASAADGAYVARYELYVDYALTGPETNLTFTFGDVSIAAAWTEAADSFAMQGAVEVLIGAAWTEAEDIFSATGSVADQAVSGAAAWTEAADVFAIEATALGLEIALAWTEAADICAIAAHMDGAEILAAIAWTEAADSMAIAATRYANAPRGSGYAPQRRESTTRPSSSNTSRPESTQRNNR
jgi:hypothetical protein